MVGHYHLCRELLSRSSELERAPIDLESDDICHGCEGCDRFRGRLGKGMVAPLSAPDLSQFQERKTIPYHVKAKSESHTW
jgi:hypothetical protein